MSLSSLISGGLNCCFPILPSLYSSLNFCFSSVFLPLLNFYLHLISFLSFTLHHILHFTLVLYLHIYPYPALLILNPCPPHLPIYPFLLCSTSHPASLFLSGIHSFLRHMSPSFSVLSSIYSRADDSGLVTQKESLPVRSLVLGDIQRMGSEVAYMVGPLRCRGDSTFTCMHIFSIHHICTVKNVQKKTGLSIK